MPSHSTSVRLAPLDPMPRSDSPCVVGCATRLEFRRKRLKPGTIRSRSSRLTPGMRWSLGESSKVMGAGVSVETFSITVIELTTGSSFASGDVGDVCAQSAGIDQISAMPAGLRQPGRRCTEYNLDIVIAVRSRH